MDYFPYTKVEELLLVDKVNSRMKPPYEMVVKFSTSHMFWGLRGTTLMATLVEAWQERKTIQGELAFVRYHRSEEFFTPPPEAGFHLNVTSSTVAVCLVQAFLKGLQNGSLLNEIEDGIVLVMVTDGRKWFFYKGRSLREEIWKKRVSGKQLGCDFEIIKDK